MIKIFKIRQKPKKAFFLGEFTLKIIIAVICIGLLVYLLFAMYDFIRSNEKINQAKGTLDLIEGGIASADLEGSYQNIIYQPIDWGIFYFEQEIIGKCSGNCLCVCEVEPGFWGRLWELITNPRQIEKCRDEKKGICRKIDNLDVVPIGLDKPKDIEIIKSGDIFKIRGK